LIYHLDCRQQGWRGCLEAGLNRDNSLGFRLPLERVITDFGSDVPFGQIPAKLQEYYGISVPVSSAQAMTQQHAQQMLQTQLDTLKCDIPEVDGVEYLIVASWAKFTVLTRNRATRNRARNLTLAPCHPRWGCNVFWIRVIWFMGFHFLNVVILMKPPSANYLQALRNRSWIALSDSDLTLCQSQSVQSDL